jgi:N-acetyl-anhydromuramyl-L-alanine amidase AmpD
MRKITLVVVHCSDSDIKSHDNIETIRGWHVNERGWTDIGYHYFINQAGALFPGRKESTVGAHVAGHNAGSIGICLSGRKSFTDAQMVTLEKLLKDICKRHGLQKTDILGHSDLQPGKTCPNFDLHKLISSWEWH